jgi:long-chain acyl-CoA synthetase
MKLLLKIPGIRGKIYSKIRGKLNDSFGGNFHEVVIGGAALNKEVEIFLRKIKFRFSTGYGMTECGPLIAYANWDKNQPFSCGRPVDTLEVKIDSDSPESKVGEIMVRGENVMTGYYKNEVATSEALDKDGWLHTGDLGTFGKDSSLYIKGRSKSMILGPSGQNIYPEEIEAVINNFPLVQEALVVETKGKLIALVYPDKDTKEELDLNQKQMVEKIQGYREQINKELSKHMQVSEIKVVAEEFAKTPKKSIRRFLYTSPNFEVHTLQ